MCSAYPAMKKPGRLHFTFGCHLDGPYDRSVVPFNRLPPVDPWQKWGRYNEAPLLPHGSLQLSLPELSLWSRSSGNRTGLWPPALGTEISPAFTLGIDLGKDFPEWTWSKRLGDRHQTSTQPVAQTKPGAHSASEIVQFTLHLLGRCK